MATIHGVILSPYVRKTIIFHLEKGVEFTLAHVMPGDKSEAFRKISPLGKVPGYTTDDDFSFSDSSVICAFVERDSEGPKLYPSDLKAFARALWLEEYCDTRLMESTGGLYVEKCLATAFFGRAVDQEKVDSILAESLPEALGYIEAQLGEGDWLVGDQISIADIALTTHLANLHHAGYEINSADFPKLARVDAMWRNRASLKGQLEQEAAMFPKA